MDFLYRNQREIFSLIEERTEPRSPSYEGEYVTKSSVKRSFGLHTKFLFIMSNKTSLDSDQGIIPNFKLLPYHK